MAKDQLLSEVKKLISLGKEKGFLTYDELNATLPAEMVSSEQLGNLMTMFGEMDIEIIDTAEGERYQKTADGEEAVEEIEESEALEEGEKEIDLTPGVLSRTDDPVRLYLKEMGSVHTAISRAICRMENLLLPRISAPMLVCDLTISNSSGVNLSGFIKT